MRSKVVFVLSASLVSVGIAQAGDPPEFGTEKSVPNHFVNGQEFASTLKQVLKQGSTLFSANWTVQEGALRPKTKGTGSALSDPNSPLTGARNMNRISAPDANSCAGCHNLPFVGGGGDFVANVFVLGQRFDFATFDGIDTTPTKGAVNEGGQPVTHQTIANSRNTLGMFGSGYIELLARQITVDLQADRDGCGVGQSVSLISENTGDLDFGTLSRDGSGNWITSGVVGLPSSSLTTSGPSSPPSLVLKPFHQAGAVVSLRQFTNNAMNHHHGIQTEERFGDLNQSAGADADEDGFPTPTLAGQGLNNEMTVADVTAASVWQATLPVPCRVIPRDDATEEMVRRGEDNFRDIGCAACHLPELPLLDTLFTEPNPFNPAAGNLDPGDAYIATYGTYSVNLNNSKLPLPRLKEKNGVTMVPCFTDFKLHDITDPGLTFPDDQDEEALDMHLAPPTAGTNAKFLTRKLWGIANEPPYFHHGRYTTMREAIEAHKGEAQDSADGWAALSDDDKNSIIEFLKTLQVMKEGTKADIVDEKGKPRKWQDFAATDFD